MSTNLLTILSATFRLVVSRVSPANTHGGPASPGRLVAQHPVSLHSLSVRSLSVLVASGILLAISSGGSIVAQPPGESGPPSGYDEQMADDMDMDMSESYESGGYGMDPSAGMATGGNISGAIDGGLSRSLGQFDFVSLLAPTTGTKMPTGPILLGQAGEAFSRGHQKLALDLLFGHMVAEYEDAGAAFKSIKYSPMLRRPVWQMRWGVSIATRLDGVTDAKPLTADARPGGNGFDSGGYDSSGSEQGYDPGYDSGYDPGMDSRRGGRPPVANEVPAVPQVNPGESLEASLGLVATMFADQFSTRFRSGAFGAALPSLAPPVVEAPPANVATNNYDSGYDDMSNDEQMQDMYEAEMDGRGMGPGGMGPGGARKPVQPPPSLAPAPLSPAPGELPMWVPGIVFVGEGHSSEILETAKAAGVEILVHFDVAAKARGNETQNISRCRVFQVSTGKSLISSKGIDSMEALQLTRSNRGTNTDYVTEQMHSVWMIIDKQMTVVPLPQLTAEIAKKRVGMIVTAPPKERLQTLAEIRMYQAAGLLTPDEVALAFDLVAGDDAMELLYGPVNERRELVRAWATE